jgi:hypothetical protein
MDEQTDPEATTESDEVAIRRRRALERLGKIAVYTTPLVIGLLSSEAWGAT